MPLLIIARELAFHSRLRLGARMPDADAVKVSGYIRALLSHRPMPRRDVAMSFLLLGIGKPCAAGDSLPASCHGIERRHTRLDGRVTLYSTLF